jgi:two-component system cell cycle sensor histidine kinase/response regulator CckA
VFALAFGLAVTPRGRGGDGQFVGWLDMTTELTELQVAAEALRVSEERFRQVFELAPLGVALLDAEGQFIQVNQAFAQMLGYETGELCQRTMAEISHPDDAAPSLALLRQSPKDPRQPSRLDKRYLRKDGTIAWGSMTTVSMGRTNGQPLRLLAMIQDTTEQHQSELQLREQATLLDISQDAICVQSLSGRIEFWNPACEQLYGWTRAEALGANTADLLFGRTGRELLQAQADVLAHGSWSGELQQTTRNGRTVHTQTRFSLVRDAHDQPKSILVVSTDITERRKLEQEFLRAQRLECVGALASGVAHDLNNVFAPILMVAELLACRAMNTDDTELLAVLQTSADRGSSIVRQLLTFSRGQESERAELQVHRLLKEMYRLASETFPKSIQLAVRTEPDLWRVVGDITQIHQVLLNLSLNARDAMPNGGSLTLEARNFRAGMVFCQSKPEAQPGPYVVIEVTDTGCGIPPAIQDKIFDPYFTTKPLGLGTGLGLPTVLSIVKGHRGFMDFDSCPGQGTRFRVYLPAAENCVAGDSLTQHPAASAGHGELVLVVDDEEAICLATKQILTEYGYVPLLARDGAEAIVLFARHQAGLRFVLTDLMMPGLDGAAFIRAVRKLSPDIPIVAMSGMPPEHFAADLAGQKHVSFLAKPFTGQTLIQAFQDFPAPEPLPPASVSLPGCNPDR